jgi:PIN domain nuclease of toxin-antitoxin system
VRLLFDTHVWIWQSGTPERLSSEAERAIADPGSELFLSPISAWETLMLARKGRLRLTPTPREWVLDALRRSGLMAMPLTHAIAVRSERLAGFESEDPADKFLVATALEHDLTLVTADEAMRDFEPVATLW